MVESLALALAIVTSGFAKSFLRIQSLQVDCQQSSRLRKTTAEKLRDSDQSLQGVSPIRAVGWPGGDARRSTGLEQASSIAITGGMVTANAGVDRQRAASHHQKKQ
jgi:hypothetical protein